VYLSPKLYRRAPSLPRPVTAALVSVPHQVEAKRKATAAAEAARHERLRALTLAEHARKQADQQQKKAGTAPERETPSHSRHLSSPRGHG
jgi:hypothetical protein